MSPLHPHFEMVIENRRKAQLPSFSELSPENAREQIRRRLAAAPPPQDMPDLAQVTEEMIEGPHGAIPIRRYVPLGQPKGTCVYYHAGGWLLGDLEIGDETCRRLAGGADVEVISVDYRLAPEHPWPQPFDDCYAALEWTAAHYAGPLLVAGESAGGNLAAAVAIKARDANGPAIAGQIILYGVMDHDFETGSYREVGSKGWMLTTTDMQYCWNQYCPDTALRAFPLLSPLRVADAGHLPPLFLAVGDLDILRDECVAYAAKLQAAGVPVELRVDPGMLHGYFAMTQWAEPARQSVDAMIAWTGARVI